MSQFLDTFFETVKWPMDRPPAYGAFHLIFTLVGFAVCGFVAWKLRKVSDKAAGRVLFLVGLLLALSEVYKQFFNYYVLMDNCYDWGELPFQLCSIPMYLCLIVPFLRNYKVQRSLYSFMVLYNLLGGAIAFTEPSGLLHSYWYLTMHAMIWHLLLVFVGLFLCFSKRGGTAKNDYRGATVTFLVLCAVAFCINLFVQNVVKANINMFFVGPGDSPIIVFKQFSQWFGWYVSTLIYIPAVCLGAYIIFRLILLCQKKQPIAA